jgi:hypothetical protein
VPDARPKEQRDSSLADVEGLATIRVDENYSFANEDWSSDAHQIGNDRAMMDEAEENVRSFAIRQAKKDPQSRPYAHPFYWAGFQVTGW